MSLPGMSPGEPFVEARIRTEEFMDIEVGGQIVKVCLAGAASILGVSALSEAKDILVDTLASAFGKSGRAAASTGSEAPSINDIKDNELDGTPETKKTLDFQEADEGEATDAAEKSFTDKHAMFQALANKSTKAEKDQQQKKTSVETMMETQRTEYEKFINELLDKQQEYLKQMYIDEMKQMDKLRDYNMTMENTVRQKDDTIRERERETKK